MEEHIANELAMQWARANAGNFAAPTDFALAVVKVRETLLAPKTAKEPLIPDKPFVMEQPGVLLAPMKDFGTHEGTHEVHVQAAAGGDAFDTADRGPETMGMPPQEYNRIAAMERQVLDARIANDVLAAERDELKKRIAAVRESGTGVMPMQSVDEMLRKESLETERRLAEALLARKNIDQDRKLLRIELESAKEAIEANRIEHALFRVACAEAEALAKKLADKLSMDDPLWNEAREWLAKLGGAR